MAPRAQIALRMLFIISGVIHISGLIDKSDLHFYAGLAMLIIGCWSLLSFVKDGKLVKQDITVIETLGYKWWRLLELVVAVAALSGVILQPDNALRSLLITAGIYLMIIVIFDHRQILIITSSEIVAPTATIDIREIRAIDFQKHKIKLLLKTYLSKPFINEFEISLRNISPENQELLINRLNELFLDKTDQNE